MTVIRHEAEVPLSAAGRRFDQTLAEMFPDYSRSRLTAWVKAGAVTLDGAVAPPRQLLHGGEQVRLEAELEAEVASQPEAIALTIVHEDEHVLVLDKPAGLVVHPGAGQPTGTLVHGLLARYPEIVEVGVDPVRPGIVHRLDKGTTGLLLVARSQPAYQALVAALAARTVHRRYRALAWGELSATSGLIDAPIGRSAREPTRMAVTVTGKPARTRYQVLSGYTEPVVVTELACTLETGRTHQIRVHLGSIGHPVVGDLRYGGARQSLAMDRPFLHAELLELDHPISGAPLRFESPLPADLEAVLAGLS